MALGKFTLTGNFPAYDESPKRITSVRIIGKPAVVVDKDGNKIYTAPSRPVTADGSFAIELVTDVTEGESTAIGYRVIVALYDAPSVAAEFWAQPAGATIDMADITSQVVDPVSPDAASTTELAAVETRVTTVETDKANSADLATVATTGAYADLDGQPAIPSTAADVGAEPAGLSAETKAAQDAAMDRRGVVPEEVLRAEFIRSKGYSVGTGGRAAVALRWDHWLNVLGATVLPLLRARSLPSGVSVFSGMLEGTWADANSTNYTWADVQNWCLQDGMEVWCHSRSHAWDAAWGYDGIVEEIVNSKAALEAAMPKVKIQGWMQPGTGTPVTYDGFDTTALEGFYTTEAGRLLRQTYPIAETDAIGHTRTLPTGPVYGMGHATLDDINYTQAKAIVDRAVAFGEGVEFMAHVGLFDTPNRMTMADFTAFLDYLVQLRDAGDIDIVTPSALYMADRERTTRAELVAGGNFDNGFHPTSNPGRWETIGGNTLVDDNGTKWVRVPTTGTIFSQGNAYAGWSGFSGETFMVEAKFRRVADATVRARFRVEDQLDVANWSEDKLITIPSGTTPYLYRKLITIPANTRYPRFYFGRYDGGELDVTGVRVYKV